MPGNTNVLHAFRRDRKGKKSISTGGRKVVLDASMTFFDWGERSNATTAITTAIMILGYFGLPADEAASRLFAETVVRKFPHDEWHYGRREARAWWESYSEGVKSVVSA